MASIYDRAYDCIMSLQYMLRGTALTPLQSRSLLMNLEDVQTMIRIATKPEQASSDG